MVLWCFFYLQKKGYLKQGQSKKTHTSFLLTLFIKFLIPTKFLLSQISHSVCFNIFSCMNSGSTNDCLAWDLSSASSVVEDPNWPSDFVSLVMRLLFAQTIFLHLIQVVDLDLGRMPLTFICPLWGNVLSGHLHYLFSAGVFCGVTFNLIFLWTKVLMALAILHNFCIDETDISIRQWFHEDVLEGDQIDVTTNEVFLDEDEHPFLTTCWTDHQCHNYFRALLEKKGLHRPNHNINSRA